MNLQFLLLNNQTTNDSKLNNTLVSLANDIKINKIKFSDKRITLGSNMYYKNALPVIPESRDLLTKASDVCNIKVNWKNEYVPDGMTPNEFMNTLKQQYGFAISVVDKGYTRNNFKNKESYWVVFDNENTAKKSLNVFNRMFRTAIEQDCINEYKHFKHNPKKRPLTYDKLVDNAYDLYDLIDNGEI